MPSIFIWVVCLHDYGSTSMKIYIDVSNTTWYNTDEFGRVRVSQDRAGNKIAAIKAFRHLVGTGLKESKDAIEGNPSPTSEWEVIHSEDINHQECINILRREGIIVTDTNVDFVKEVHNLLGLAILDNDLKVIKALGRAFNELLDD